MRQRKRQKKEEATVSLNLEVVSTEDVEEAEAKETERMIMPEACSTSSRSGD
jgi:hypothetical protein